MRAIVDRLSGLPVVVAHVFALVPLVACALVLAPAGVALSAGGAGDQGRGGDGYNERFDKLGLSVGLEGRTRTHPIECLAVRDCSIFQQRNGVALAAAGADRLFRCEGAAGCWSPRGLQPSCSLAAVFQNSRGDQAGGDAARMYWPFDSRHS